MTAELSGRPETILGRPVVEALDISNIASGTSPITFGHFKTDYRIFDRANLDILPDLLTLRISGLGRIHARRLVGGGVACTDVFWLTADQLDQIVEQGFDQAFDRAGLHALKAKGRL